MEISADGFISKNTLERVNYYVMDSRSYSFHLVDSRNGRLTFIRQYCPRPACSRNHLNRSKTISRQKNPVNRSVLLVQKY